MTARRIVAVTRRLLAQFRHDPRTLALMFVAPLLILSLFWFLLRGGGAKPAMGVVDEDRGRLGAVVAAQLERSSQVDATRMDASTDLPPPCPAARPSTSPGATSKLICLSTGR